MALIRQDCKANRTRNDNHDHRDSSPLAAPAQSPGTTLRPPRGLNNLIFTFTQAGPEKSVFKPSFTITRPD